MIFYYVLFTLSKLLAPFIPFLAEKIYQELKSESGPESVHLYDYPKAEKEFIDEKLEKEMQTARDIVSMALAERAKMNIGVRQALQELRIKNHELRIKGKKEILDLIKDEVNVKEIVFDGKIKEEVELDTEISEELKQEGHVREIIRRVQDLRKQAGLTPSDTNITVHYFASPELAKTFLKNQQQILTNTRSRTLKENQTKQGEFLTQQDFEIDKQSIWFALSKVM